MRAEDVDLMPHQLDFTSSEQSLVLFGGGAGGGKTYAALMDNLQGIHDPDYTSAIFRTTTTEIEKGLWIEAKKMYETILKDSNGKFIKKARINEKSKTITFPSGAVTFFGYLEIDKHADGWYGIELTKVYFEEFQFRSWYQFNILRSRNRSMAKVIKGIRCTLNPDPNHFVYKFVERYLDEDKYPVKELSGKTAWYLIVKDVLYTDWDREALQSKFPPNKSGKLKQPLSYTYIPATLDDNVKLMENDPTYEDKLDALPEDKRKQLRLGCWVNTDDKGVYFKREWLGQADKVPLQLTYCRAYDLAFSEPTPKTSPDFTAGIKLGKAHDGYYYLIGDYIPEFGDEGTEVKGRFRKRSGERDALILKQAKYDTKKVHLVLPEDSGAAGKDSFVQKVKYFTANGFVVKRDNVPHNASKLTKFEPFACAAEHGLVYIVKDTFNEATYEAIMNELEIFDGIKKSGRTRKDDWVDAIATAFNHLSKADVIPDLTLPDMSMVNPFKIGG